MRGSDILRYVIVSGYVAFCQIKVFRQLIFHYLENVFAGRIYPTGRSLETPDMEEWAQRIEVHDDEHSLIMAWRLGYCYV